MKWPSRRVKIVATIGPASSDSSTIENLIKAGVNVMRLNFSHGTKEDHRNRYEMIRKASQKLQRNVAILQDLQGPKLRVGKFEGGNITLEKGETVVFQLETQKQKKTKTGKTFKIIPFNYEKLPREIQVGHRILMDDGNLEVVVTGIEGDEIFAQVVFGGVLKDHKGMNFPDTKISIESFTPKDKEDLLFGLQLGVDYVALSFVRSAQDVRTIQKYMHAHKKNTPVVAKIEKAEAIANLSEIVSVTDAVMVARGDLAVEVGTAQVPILQKQIIRECRRNGIPVITATQMLESMINSPRPTRAEASDVANAVLDGSDAVMLSAETASGKFPVLAVSVMQNIILETESRKESLHLRTEPDTNHNNSGSPTSSIVEALEHAASQLATWVGAKAIACTTHSGSAARALAKHRPSVPIYAFTDNKDVEHQLALLWGVETIGITAGDSIEKIFESAEQELVNRRVAEKGDVIVLTAGWPPLKRGTTNLLKVVTIRKEILDDSASVPKRPKTPTEKIDGYRTRNAQFVLDQNLCIQCGGCVEVCPNDIFGIQNRRVYLKESNCKNCTFDDACMEICPTGAVEIIQLA